MWRNVRCLMCCDLPALPLGLASQQRRLLVIVALATLAVAWWWRNRTTYPLLSEVAFSYMCVQASSTPSERVSRILPEKADMLIFLFCFWNCWIDTFVNPLLCFYLWFCFLLQLQRAVTVCIECTRCILHLLLCSDMTWLVQNVHHGCTLFCYFSVYFFSLRDVYLDVSSCYVMYRLMLFVLSSLVNLK